MSQAPLGYLCYAGPYREWVSALHEHLEMHLGAGTIWFDRRDLGPGCQWKPGLEDGLARARRVVLVATPETFASEWVRSELDAFCDRHEDWCQERLIQLALLVDTPLPPFLGSVQQVDFRQNDDETYAEALRQLVGALRGLRDPRKFPKIRDGISAPSWQAPGLPPDLRRELVGVLGPLLNSEPNRVALAAKLELNPHSLEERGSPECAASVALILSAADCAPSEAALRVIFQLRDMKPEGYEAARADLERLVERLQSMGRAPETRDKASHSIARAQRPVELVHLTGTVPPRSAFYVERETDKEAIREIERRPGLVHVIGPCQIGKSSLLTRLTDRARSASNGMLVIQVDFQDAFGEEAISNLRQLLAQLADEMLRATGVDPREALDIESTRLSPKAALKRLVADRILANHPQGVLLALDELDQLERHDGCKLDFLEMLRGWHELGKRDPVWARLRIAIAYSSRNFTTSSNRGGSPCDNVGTLCRMRDFREVEVRELLKKHGLDPERESVAKLMKMLGGHPYLVRRSLYARAVEGNRFEEVLEEAICMEGPLGDHLRGLLRNIENQKHLIPAIQDLLRQSFRASISEENELAAMGLVCRGKTNGISFRCQLYRDVLEKHLR